VLGRKGRERDDGDRRVEDDDEADRAEEAAGEVATRAPNLLGEVGDRLEAGVGKHRQRQRERDRVPARVAAERRALGQRVRRKEQCKPEDDEQHLRGEIDERDHEREPEDALVAKQPEDGDARDHAAPGDDVPRLVHGREHRRGRVVRNIQGGQRDHDQVVQEKSPARHEAPKVVEGDPDEGGGATGLPNCCRPLRVGKRDDQEEGAGQEQDGRREPERVEGDDPEREVDRGGDLAVGDREQCRRVENALQSWELARHRRSLCPRPADRDSVRPAFTDSSFERPSLQRAGVRRPQPRRVRARSRYSRPTPRAANSKPSR